MDVADISRMLAERIDDLVPRLLPGAVRDGHEWRCGGIDGSVGRSMGINRSALRGVWQDFASDHLKGDALDLVAHTLFGGNKGEAVKWAKSWLGIDGLDPARLKTVQAESRKRAGDEEKKAQEKYERNKRMAKAIWLGGKADLIGTPVDLYMLGRGIGLSDLARVPGSLRYVPSLEYPPLMNEGVIENYAAMVALIQNGKGEQIAVHRTFLHQPFPGVWKKAPVKDPKLTLGSYRGGFISLSRGASDLPIGKAPKGDKVILCEGIEDGLTLALVRPAFRVLACISVGNFCSIELPDAIEEVILARDNDPETIVGDDGTVRPHPARVAVQKAIDRFIDQGRRVRDAASPHGKDFNAALMAGAVTYKTGAAS